MPKFIVNVTRTSYASTEIEVDATNEAEARDKAEDAAGDYEFSTDNAEYEATDVRPASPSQTGGG